MIDGTTYTVGMDGDRTISNFVEPTTPDVTPILAMHRGHDGYVTFHRRDDGGRFEDLYAVRAADLSESLFREQLAADLDRDSYFSVNGYYRHGYGRSNVQPSLYRPLRNSDSLRWLTCCYVDIDCHKLGIGVGQAIGSLIDMQDAGTIPPASMFTRSGRGVWALWFLRDRLGGDGPQRATTIGTGTYFRIQRQLLQITDHLGSDSHARDAARVTRVPGSVNATAGLRVHYWIQADKGGQPFTYTLEELCGHLNVTPVMGMTPTLAKAVSAEQRAKGISGHAAVWERRLRAFLLLTQKRGQYVEGMRHHACWLYANFMEKRNVSQDEIYANVLSLARRGCVPALPDEEAIEAVEARKGGKLLQQTIGDWLDVTPEESAELLGGVFPPASRFGVTAPVDLSPTTQAEKREQRRGVLASVIGKGKPPTLRELQDTLADEYGITASLATLRTDLTAIGKANPRARNPDDASQTKLIDG